MKIRGNTVGTTEKTSPIVVDTLESMGIHKIKHSLIYDSADAIDATFISIGDKLLVRGSKTGSSPYSIVTVTNKYTSNGVTKLSLSWVGIISGMFYRLVGGSETHSEFYVLSSEGLFKLSDFVPKIENTSGGGAVYYVAKDGKTYLQPVKLDPVAKAIVQRASGNDSFVENDDGEIRIRRKTQIDAGELMPKTDYVAICKAQTDELYVSKAYAETFYSEVTEAFGVVAEALESYIYDVDTLLGGD